MIRSHEELDVYRMAFETAMRIFELSKQFPREERYSLTDQIRRSSRSVCSNIAEAWRKRRYQAAFVSKLSDAESEAAETQTWIRFAVACGYWPETVGAEEPRKWGAKEIALLCSSAPLLLRTWAPLLGRGSEGVSNH